MAWRDWFYLPLPEPSLEGLISYIETHPVYFGVITFLLICLFLTLNLSYRIMVARIRKRNHEANAKQAALDTEDLLTEYLGGALNKEEASNALNRLLTNRSKPLESIALVFRSYFQMLSGESKEELKRLFLESRFAAITQKRLAKPDEHVILYIELAALAQFNSVKQELKKLLRNDHLDVRFQALCALVDLFKFNALKYMLEVKYKPSEWEEMILMQKLLRDKSNANFDFNLFLNSNNDQLVRFAVRAAQLFNRFELGESFRELLHHPSESIRRRVYEAAGVLLMNELQSDIIQAFPQENLVTKRTILKTLQNLGDDDALPFLTELFLAKEPELSLKAGKAIYFISGKNSRIDEIALADEQLMRMVEHIKDPLIA
ncbi:MAG: HEAT repeat domain-containing protein [Bacteroidetes bacterium]|nr:MAG: HEAT repeat domain-containing protein [Bacteroidota bacterium]